MSILKKQEEDKIVELKEASKRKDEESGITVIPDDSAEKRIDEEKRKIGRAVKKVSGSIDGRKRRISTPAAVIVVILILILVFVIADVQTGGTLATVNGKLVSMFSRGSTEKFSVAIDGDTVYRFEAYDNGFTLLTENGIAYYSSSGKMTGKQQFTYSSPSMSLSGSRALIFDRGNTGYSIQNNKTLYSQQTSDKSIIDAAVSSRDNCAIAVREDNAKSILYGYDAKGKIIYQWNCPDGYISDVALYSSGKKAAVTVLDSENAVLSSRVYILDFAYDSEYAVFTYPDETVLGVKFLSGKKLQVISDKRVYLVSGTEQETVLEYNSSEICYTDLSSSTFTAVVTDDYSHDDSYVLSVFGKNGKLRFSVPLSGKVEGVAASGKSIAVLFTDKTETYSKRGKLVGRVSDMHHYEDIVINGNYLYVLSSDSVKKFPAYGEFSADYHEDETA